MNPRCLTGAVLMLAAPLATAADAYRCNNGNLERRVEVVYETGGVLPCEVHYYKDSEAPGSREVLWTANNEAGYCEARAAEFIERLRGFGWDCVAAAPDTAEADDTEALAPADDMP